MLRQPEKGKRKMPSEKAAKRADYEKKSEYQRERKFQAKWQIGRPWLKLDENKGMLCTV